MRSSDATGRAVELAKTQEGIITTRQLRTCGLSASRIARWQHDAGWLERVHHGVHALGGPPRTARAWRFAAVLAAGEGAALSHTDAAAAHDLRSTAAARLHVTAPTRHGRGRRDGLVVHRARLPPDEVVDLAGLRVTSIARTCLDCAGMLSEQGLLMLLERAELLRVFDRRALDAAVRTGFGRPAAARLARALEIYDPRLVAARSTLERTFVSLLAAHGEDDGLELAHEVAGFEVDVCFPADELIVELDGAAYHLNRGQKRRDVRRDAELTRRGWRTVRILDEDVEHRPDWVLDLVRGLRRHRRGAHEDR